nr:Pycsar system effector family protein [uncultured Mucilaginibacter sp.]
MTRNAIAMNFQQLLHEIKQYVTSYFATHADPALIYHDIGHTRRVVQYAGNIANHYQLNDEDYFIVMAAAWFHDTGFLIDKTRHEENGARLAAEYLNHLGLSDTIIEHVKGCILATKMPQRAVGLLQQIVCDADLYHLGTKQFEANSKLLMREIEAEGNIKIDKKVQLVENIKMLSSHVYYTDFVKQELKDQLEQNLQTLLRKQALEVNAGRVEQAVETSLTPQVAKQDKTNKPGRGIETMFRITSGNNQRLSDMADNKAHILITVNSIILSAIISLVLRKLDENSIFIIPTFILLGVSLLSITFSILATRPSIPNGIFTREDIDSKRVNLLFFGNFYRVGFEEYSAGMKKVMGDKDFLYGTLIRDVYSQGVVLGRKYRLLRVAYNIFMFGLIIAVLAYTIASLLNLH